MNEKPRIRIDVAVLREICQKYCRSTKEYHLPPIPDRKEKNARKSMRIPESEEIFALLDLTLFGSAKHALVVTENGLYWKDQLSEARFSWDDLERINVYETTEKTGKAMAFGPSKKLHVFAAPSLAQENNHELLNLLSELKKTATADPNSALNVGIRTMRERRDADNQEEPFTYRCTGHPNRTLALRYGIANLSHGGDMDLDDLGLGFLKIYADPEVLGPDFLQDLVDDPVLLRHFADDVDFADFGDRGLALFEDYQQNPNAILEAVREYLASQSPRRGAGSRAQPSKTIKLQKKEKVAGDEDGNHYLAELPDFGNRLVRVVIKPQSDVVLTFYPMSERWFEEQASLEEVLKDNRTFDLKELATFHVQRVIGTR